MNKNEIRQIKSIQSSNTCSNLLNDIIGKNISYQRDSNISSKNNKTPPNKSASSHHILNSLGDETKSKSTLNLKIKKKEKEKKDQDKSDICKNKKRNRDKIAKLLKNNERVKIPRGKRRSVAGNSIQFNINNMLKSLTPPKVIKVRTDKNGIEINKLNKKKVHITFLDDISPNNKFTETINIQSFKQFNIIEKLPGEDNISNYNKCCNIF